MNFSLCDGAIIPWRFDKNGRISVCVSVCMCIQRALASQPRVDTWRLHKSYIVSLLQFYRYISRWCFNWKTLFTFNFVWSIQWKHTRLMCTRASLFWCTCLGSFTCRFHYMWFCGRRHWQSTMCSRVTLWTFHLFIILRAKISFRLFRTFCNSKWNNCAISS